MNSSANVAPPPSPGIKVKNKYNIFKQTIKLITSVDFNFILIK